jgi:hypothetical protein
MELIYSAIQKNPDYFAWIFGLINILWGLFMYFNKQSHDKELLKITHDLSLESERRRTIYELKINQYESYVASLDEFGKKYQVDLPKKMQPIFDKYLNDYLAASLSENKDKELEVICWFNEQISALMRSANEDMLKLQSESNKLKLTATDEMLDTFSQLEILTKASTDKAFELMAKFQEIILTRNDKLANELQQELTVLGVQTQATAKQLMNLMRQELLEI